MQTNHPAIVQMVKVYFKGRFEVLTIAEAQELSVGLVNALQAHATDSEAIKMAVCREFGLRRDEIESDSRPDRIAFPRQVAMWMHRTITNFSLAEIGKQFPRTSGAPRDHGTVLHAYRTVENRIATDKELRGRVTALQVELTGKFERKKKKKL